MIDLMQNPVGELGPVTTIEIIEDWCLPFSVGNALAYVLRAKDNGYYKEDLVGSVWFLRRHYEALVEDLPCSVVRPRLLPARSVAELLRETGLDKKFEVTLNGIRFFDSRLLVSDALSSLIRIAKGYE